MDCSSVSEFLPWYLNGTLEPDERRQVREHLGSCPRCAAELGATRDVFGIHGSHLPSSVLVDHAFGRSPAEMPAELVERHLAACARCREELEMVRDSRGALEAEGLELPAPTPVPMPRRRYLALAASLAGVVALSGWVWTGLLLDRAQQDVARLETALREVETAPPAGGGASGGAGDGLSARVEALAAENQRLQEAERGLRQQVEAQQAQSRQLTEQVAALSAPLPNVLVEDLQPAEMVLRGEADEPGRVEIPAGVGGVTLILNSQLAGPGLEPRLVLLDETGRTRWSLDGLQRTRHGVFTVALPGRLLERGSYTLELRALQDGEWVALESYYLKVA